MIFWHNIQGETYKNRDSLRRQSKSGIMELYVMNRVLHFKFKLAIVPL